MAQNLPYDVLFEIFLHLIDIQPNITHCALVCRAWNKPSSVLGLQRLYLYRFGREPPIANRFKEWKLARARRWNPTMLLRRFSVSLSRSPRLTAHIRDVHLFRTPITLPLLQSLITQLVNLRELRLDELDWLPAPYLKRGHCRPQEPRCSIDSLILGQHFPRGKDSSIPEPLDVFLFFDRCNTLELSGFEPPRKNFLQREPDLPKVSVHTLIIHCQNDGEYLDAVEDVIDYQVYRTIPITDYERWIYSPPSGWL